MQFVMIALSMNTWFCLLSFAPVSVIAFLFSLKTKKKWLMRISMVGMLISVVLLGILQYEDYKHFTDCLLEGKNYSPPLQMCVLEFPN
ncbi:hypothetical protein L4D77_16435 [Photobacterium frigidiphilum]|uniref:hypothetical protein n=1 Tax=Photobacterium frigidiphilum TaxID=264736 RepID=UPI003D13176A